MRKMLLTPFILCTVALLSTLSMPAVHATPWTKGGGTWDFSIPEEGMEEWFVGDYIIRHVWGGGGNLWGTFEGIWIHDEWQVVHPSGIMTMVGVWVGDPMGVNGVSGTIRVLYWGRANIYTGVFHGRWVIISGTGGLANLRGRGTIWADPAIDPVFGYTVRYDFDP